MNRILSTLLLSLTMLACAATARAQAQTYKVGTAKQKITPCTNNLASALHCAKNTDYIDLNVGDIALLGSGPDHKSDTIHVEVKRVGLNDVPIKQELWVRVLAIEEPEAGRRMVLVGVDVAVFERSFIDDVRDLVRGYKGLRPEEVMLNASHTHSAPSLKLYCPGASCPIDSNTSENIDNAEPNAAYVAEVKARIVTAIKAAMDSMTDASLYFGTGSTDIGKYRRKDAGKHSQPNQFGIPADSNAPYPQRLDVLEARTAQGTILATAFFVGTHPVATMLDNKVSSDFVGWARDEVEADLHDEGMTGAMALFFQGFGGDINPQRFNFQANTTASRDTGDELAADVLSVRQSMTNAPALSGSLKVSSQVQFLGLDRAGTPWQTEGFNNYAFLPTEVQTLTVGTGANAWSLVAVEHEVVSEFANYFRNAWPDPARVTLAGYSNGVESYIPNERMLWHDRSGVVSPDRFEGYMAIRSYGLARPDWSNSDLLSAPKGGSSPHSLSLNGTGAHVRVPYGTALNITGSLTVEAWVKLNTLGTQRGIVERFGAFNSGSGGYDLRVTADGKLHFFIGEDGTDTSKYKFIRGGTALSTGIWHHVAGVFRAPAFSGDEGEMRVYVDGVLDGSDETPSGLKPGTGTSDLIIGAFGNTASAGFFDGLIDEVRVTSGTVYAANFTPRGQLTWGFGTAGLWKFNGSVEVFTDPNDTRDDLTGDSSVEGNHGMLKGGAAYSASVPRDPAPVNPTDNSLSLSRPTAYVDVPFSPSLEITDSLTLEAWVKTDATGKAQSIIERFGALDSNSGGYDLRLTADGKLHFFIGYDDNDASKYKFIRSTSALSTGVWHHVAGVYERLTSNSGEMRIYVDGVLDTSASATTSVSPGTGTSHLLIGVRGNDAADGNFSGLIDEARVTAGAVYSHNFTPATRLTVLSDTRGLWKFDGETVRDSSANANDGTLVGGASHSTVVPATTSSADRSLQLNGTQQAVVTVPDAATLDVAGALTLEAWVKVNANGTSQGVIERFGPFGSTTDGGYDLRITAQGKLSFFIGYDTANNPPTADVLVGGTTVTAGVWHHVAGVYQPPPAGGGDGQMRVYVDGVLDGSKPTSRVPGQGTRPLYIGAHGNTGASGFFGGLIDEARLTAGALYAHDFTPATRLTAVAGTRGLWKFDGPSMADSSGNGNNGTGSPSYSTTIP